MTDSAQTIRKFDCNWRSDPEVQDGGISVAELTQLVTCEKGVMKPAPDKKASAEVAILKEESENTPIAMGDSPRRERLPDWMKDLPQRKLPAEPDPNFHLISEARLLQAINLTDDKEDQERLCRRLTGDVAVLETRLMPLFRQHDHEAKQYQNRYRQYQIYYIILAALATTLGGFQALFATGQEALAAIIAFAETVIALIAVSLVMISGREETLKLWLEHRRCAEQLRREYFRFLMNLAPYDVLEYPDNQLMMAERAAAINQGSYPEEPNVPSAAVASERPSVG
jgi:hypothetical protein